MDHAKSNKRIAKNTAVLYFRMFFTMAISLYTSRVVLDVLGIEDFGLYNVVGGIVMLFSFLNNAMIAASQRFISFEQGRKDNNRKKIVFSTSILIHVTIAIVILVLAESIGLWWLNSHMVIPEGRHNAAFWVYQFSIVSFLMSVISVPFTSTVIAHEKMGIYAYVTILDAVLKLFIVFLLVHISGDSLIIYGGLLLLISCADLFIYALYCKLKFEECQLVFKIDKQLYNEMLEFAGWSFVGNFGLSSKDYGVNIILNLFCGTSINAARGIGYQVGSIVNGFVSSFQTAIIPQITKRFASGETESMSRLVLTGAKFSFFLLSIVVIPLYIRADYVLSIWLKEVPSLSVDFLRLTLLMTLINSMAGPFVAAIQATGKIKIFQISIALILLSDLPFSFIFLKLGFVPYSVGYIGVITALVALIVRIALADRYLNIGFRTSFFQLIIKNALVFSLIFSLAFLFDKFIPDGFLGLVIFCLISIILTISIILLIGITKDERKMIFNKLLFKL